MSRSSEDVFLLRYDVDSNVMPFGAYQQAAHTAVSAAGVEYPDSGTVLLKPNATVLFKPEKRIATHPGFLAGMVDGLVESGVGTDRIVIADGQSGEQKDAGQTWENSGYLAAAEGASVTLKELNDQPKRDVTVPNWEVFDKLPL